MIDAKYKITSESKISDQPPNPNPEHKPAWVGSVPQN